MSVENTCVAKLFFKAQGNTHEHSSCSHKLNQSLYIMLALSIQGRGVWGILPSFSEVPHNISIDGCQSARHTRNFSHC